jgi:hypothetical protein
MLCYLLCYLQSDAAGDDKLCQLGTLMDASHASCAGLYCCSCPELDALVGVAKAAGALGARLTGEWTLGVHAGAVAADVGCLGHTWLLHQGLVSTEPARMLQHVCQTGYMWQRLHA